MDKKQLTEADTFPVIATTSQLMSTGVDSQTCRLIVLDKRIASMTEFKQIIGRGTRINEDYGKLHFTIMDFKRATALFADPKFDGDPVQVFEPRADESPVPPDEQPDADTCTLVSYPDGYEPGVLLEARQSSATRRPIDMPRLPRTWSVTVSPRSTWHASFATKSKQATRRRRSPSSSG